MSTHDRCSAATAKEQIAAILRQHLKVGGHEAWGGNYHHVDGIDAAATALAAVFGAQPQEARTTRCPCIDPYESCEFPRCPQGRTIAEPNGVQNLKAILADQPFRNSALSVHEIEVILANEGGFMPDEAVLWFRVARGNLGSVSSDKGPAISGEVQREMQRIKRLFEPGGGDREDLITYAKEIVALRATSPLSLPHQG